MILTIQDAYINIAFNYALQDRIKLSFEWEKVRKTYILMAFLLFAITRRGD